MSCNLLTNNNYCIILTCEIKWGLALMMRLVVKKIILFYVALALAVAPVELLAAHKKSHKRVHTSQKKVVSKHRSSSRYKVKASRIGAKRVKVKLRSTHHLKNAYQANHDDYDSYDGSGMLQLASTKALVINQNTGETIYAKNTNLPAPIASITKLMTAMVMLDAKQNLDEVIYVGDEDVDYIKGTSSRLSIGAGLPRGEMLQLALMASENRAASSLASNYPGGRHKFLNAMNVKAIEIGLNNTHFADPTGLDSENVSTAEDLAKLVQAAYQYPEIRFATTSPSHEVYLEGRNSPVNFNNTNGLVRGGEWQIGLSKTGFINEAGRCLVMQATIAGEPMIVVLLDSSGKLSRIGDANRIRKWMEYNNEVKPTTTGQTHETIMAGKIS
jgi:serine-type D-Ala-D-Ala endopeptidase (penicillin-binding protein 7)